MAETKLLTCFFCRGKKSLCPKCRRHVTPEQTCAEHDEAGAPCRHCKGSGFYDAPAEHVHKCPDCYGYGYMCGSCGAPVPDDHCETCGGDGETCTNCFGDGKVEILPA